ncbi:hypothetical protein VN1064_10380 [Helicobacter pylori]
MQRAQYGEQPDWALIVSMTQAISANTALVNIRKLRRYELVKPYHSISTPSIIGA